MATKRSSGDAHLRSARTQSSSAKRSKPSPPRPVDSLAPENVANGGRSDLSTRSIERASRHSRGDSSASDSTPTLGDEADADHEEDDSDSEYITTLGPSTSAYVKPDIDPDVVMAYAKELESRLHAFLPKLRQANQKLAEQSTKLNMEHVDDGEQHIEMNLNLGILEEKSAADKATTGDIRLPTDESDEPEEALLPTEGDVSSLLTGKGDQPRPSIELLDAADVVKTLPHRTEAVKS
ncbi:hypothetical protein CB0940_02886 [Cercospora beticola]|uniref:Uncharacterized protein n=1 Tax=Cercospora beticola TaxID=122368 RepID=A0A2G5I5H1_CERBT|nr:hypothetical protein CB0940_02886 [Cercospora beticola]PIB00066.1 hypothetical protein CB0940_02886 [Cercospora beticola]WPB00039.1 hypothetical protein RHO25_004658 [Cercospora beticola]CAK1361783.1 unnamed protein product [Cercospora beticola]